LAPRLIRPFRVFIAIGKKFDEEKVADLTFLNGGRRPDEDEQIYPEEAFGIGGALDEFVAKLSHGDHCFTLAKRRFVRKEHGCTLRCRYKQRLYQLASKGGRQKHKLCSRARSEPQQMSSAQVSPTSGVPASPPVAPLLDLASFQGHRLQVLPEEQRDQAA